MGLKPKKKMVPRGGRESVRFFYGGGHGEWDGR